MGSFRKKHEKGSAFLLILAGIVMLGLLIYSITRSGRMAGGVSQEQTTFATDAIMRAGDDLYNAVQKILNGGNAVSTVSFENPIVAGYINASAPASGMTKVFGPAGGGFNYPQPDATWLDSTQSAGANYGEWVFSGNDCVPFVGRGADGAGTTTACNADGVDNEDLVVMLGYLKIDICKRIDQNLSIPLCGGAPCALTAISAPLKFTGTFADGSAFISAGATYNGKHEGCWASGGVYVYYKVLAER